MTLARLCSECDRPLSAYHANAATCSVACRKARSRRLARENEEARRERDPDVAAMAEVVRQDAGDVARSEIREQLKPVVRAAITEETLQAVQDLVKLTPGAIAALADDLQSEDPGLRHRAAALVVKYTVGHPAIVKADDQEKAPVEIHVNTPRPAHGDPDPGIEAEAIEDEGLKACDMCDLLKPPEAFVDNSGRCRECWEKQQAAVKARFPDE